MIYLDNAATTYPKPNQVKLAVFNALEKFGANPGRSGHKLSLESASAIYSARREISDFFNASGPENVIFTLNCTHAINMALKGFLKPGDHVVISCLEHNAIARPLTALKYKDITFSAATVYPGEPQKTIQSFKSLIKENTKMIACMHASNVIGVRLPIEELAKLAHGHGLKILVDSAQTAGLLPIDVEKMEIDFLCAAGHKGLYGPMGTGVLVINDDTMLNTIVEGGTGTISSSFKQPKTLPERLESGTPNTTGICGLKAGIDFVKRIGLSNIAQKEHKLIELLYHELKSIEHVQLYMPKPTQEYFVPVLSFNIKGKDSEVTAEQLNKNGICVRAGLHCSPLAHDFIGTIDSGAVRVCPSCFTTQQEINAFVKVIKNLK